jgi:hypothetical protein
MGGVLRGMLLIITAWSTAPALAQEWHRFFDAAAFGTYVTVTGPKKPPSRAFSTNWMIVGAERDLGARGAILGRARFSLEPLTIPKEGYPQLLQYVSPTSGGPLLDHMRGHDLVEEVAVGLEWRPLQLYLAPIGETPLGAEPFAQRRSSIDFAEAPFAYDIQESFHVGTRVAALGLTSRVADLEYGVFHAAHSTGRHTDIDDGDIDSWGARLTIAPQSKLSAQVSAGRLTDAKLEVSTASLSYRGSLFATSAIWTKNDKLTAYSFETTLRVARSTLLGRAEKVDRPSGLKTTTHVTVGYIFDFLRASNHRAGVGVNVDYHSSTKALEPVYGHKPQSVYTFVRWRTERSERQ